MPDPKDKANEAEDSITHFERELNEALERSTEYENEDEDEQR